jgi:hypothetical protein
MKPIRKDTLEILMVTNDELLEQASDDEASKPPSQLAVEEPQPLQFSVPVPIHFNVLPRSNAYNTIDSNPQKSPKAERRSVLQKSSVR